MSQHVSEALHFAWRRRRVRLFRNRRRRRPQANQALERGGFWHANCHGEREQWTPHDARRWPRARRLSDGQLERHQARIEPDRPTEIAERCLGHTQPATRSISGGERLGERQSRMDDRLSSCRHASMSECASPIQPVFATDVGDGIVPDGIVSKVMRFPCWK